MDSLHSASQMVIGVELEVLFWTDVGLKFYEKHSTDDDALWLRNNAFREFLRQAFKKGGIASYVDLPSDLPLAAAMERNCRPVLWKLCDDCSIEPEETDPRMWSDKQYWIGVEVSSPPLPLNKDSLEQISRVAQILTHLGAETPPSTGFHVHISVNGGYSFKDVKGIVSSAVAYKQLRQFHSQERVLSRYCICPSAQFDDLDPAEIAKEIQACRNIKELLNLMHIPLIARLNPHYNQIGMRRVRYTAINYTNLDKEMKTIEFRTHCGTIKAKETVRWVLTCAAIIEVGRSSTNKFFPIVRRICKDHGNDGRNYTAVNLLRDLGKPEIAAMWTGSLHLHSWDDELVFREMLGHLYSYINFVDVVDSDLDGEPMEDGPD